MSHYHKILGVDENCSLKEIKMAYRRLAKKYHPDLNFSENAQQKFIEINEAYEILFEEYNKSNSSQYVSSNKSQQEYNDFIQLIRGQAKEKARLRYNKILKQKEEFRESGLQDLVLLLKYIGRILEPVSGILLIATPIVVCFSEKSVQPFIYLFFTWFIGGFLLLDTYTKRNHYFKLGSFYYSFNKILNIYNQTNELNNNVCFYCKGLKANSRPYIINLLKVKDITLKNLGPMQHLAGYDRKNIELELPRSRKALIIHSLTSAIKLIAILICIVLLPIDSFIWRFVTGAIFGFLGSSLLLEVTKTRSKNTYLVSYGILIKIVVWLLVISLCSEFNFKHMNISTKGYFKVVFVMMLFFDSFLEQFLKIAKKKMFKPILSRYIKIDQYFNNNYQFYLEVPVWTSIYPIIRWIF